LKIKNVTTLQDVSPKFTNHSTAQKTGYQSMATHKKCFPKFSVGQFRC